MKTDTETNDAVAKVEVIYRVDWNRTYRQTMSRVWTAISNENELSTWMKFPTRLEPRVGGAIHIAFSSEGSLEGIVCNVDQPSLLVYTWGDSLVKWGLEEVEDGVHLHFSHIGVRPELLVGLAAGWHGFLDQLEDYLLGNSRPNRYRELKSRYEKVVESQK